MGMSSVIMVAFIVVATSIAAFCFIALSRRAARTDDEEEPGPPFECGTPPKEAYPRRVAVQYFLTALLFVVILIALVLIIIWVRDFHTMEGSAKLGALTGAGIFFVLVSVGFGYAWRVGAFDGEK